MAFAADSAVLLIMSVKSIATAQGLVCFLHHCLSDLTKVGVPVFLLWQDMVTYCLRTSFLPTTKGVEEGLRSLMASAIVMVDGEA